MRHRPSAVRQLRLAGATAAAVVLWATLGACATGGGGSSPDGTPWEAESAAYLYVPNQADATVSVVDVSTHEVVETVDLQDLGFPPDAKPHDVIGAPDGSAWYVSLIGSNTVLKFDARNEVVGRAETEVPGMMALSPDGTTLYVARSMSAVDPPERVGVIRTSDMSIEEVEVLLPRPHAIAAGPDAGFAHTASLAVNRMASLEAGTGRVDLIPVEGPTHVFVHFAVSPDGSRLVGTGQMSNRLLVFDRTRPRELPLVAFVSAGSEPWHPAYTPDGRYVVFGNKKDDSVTLVDAGSWRVVAVVEGPGLSQPHGVAVSPDGERVFISNNNLDGGWIPDGWSGDGAGEDAAPPGNVVVIDVESRAIVDVIPVGHDPNGLGLRPAR